MVERVDLNLNFFCCVPTSITLKVRSNLVTVLHCLRTGQRLLSYAANKQHITVLTHSFLQHLVELTLVRSLYVVFLVKFWQPQNRVSHTTELQRHLLRHLRISQHVNVSELVKCNVSNVYNGVAAHAHIFSIAKMLCSQTFALSIPLSKSLSDIDAEFSFHLDFGSEVLLEN